MNGIGRRTRSGLFALATAAALVYGGAQAFAAPGAARDAAAVCNGPECREYCRSIGYDDGRCGQSGCACLIVVPPAR